MTGAVTYCASCWFCGGGALAVKAVVKANVTPDAVLFVDAYAPAGAPPLSPRQRAALEEWAKTHTNTLRAASEIPTDDNHDDLDIADDDWDYDPRKDQ